MVQQLGGSEWSVPGLGMGCGADYQVHICLVDGTEGWEAGWASAPLESSRRRSAAPWDLTLIGGMREGSLGPLALGLSILPPSLQGPPQKSPQAPGSPLLLSEPCVHSTCVRASFLLFFYLRLLCPRLWIRKTMEKPTPKQTHEGLFTSSSLCPSTPDIAEQGLGPRRGF